MASLKTLLLLSTLLLSISQVYTHEEHRCDHDSIEQNPGLLDLEEDMTAFGENRHLASASNIRIYPYYEFLKSTASSSYASYIQNDLVAPMIDYFQAALKVKAPVVGNLKLSTSVKKICERSTPSILTGNGVAADVFFYLDSQSASSTQIANSMYCYLASGTKRPLIVRTMINRNMLKVSDNILDQEKNMYVLMHELMHTLGFSNYQFPNFIDSNGKKMSGHIKSMSIGGSTHTVLALPSLTDKLRKFFGCSTIPGVVLENGGSGSTDGSHLERKFFVYEAMSSGSIYGRRVSEFSLGVLEASGWYTVDYSYAEPYFFGQGQGCSFINNKCTTTPQFPQEFCSGNRGCAAHGRGGGSCNSDSLAEGCKYINPMIDLDCENDEGADFASFPELQTFGRTAGSRCFTGTLSSLRQAPGSTKTFCLKFQCTGSGSSAKIQVTAGKNTFTCSEAGTVKISGYNGVLDCPDPQEFCSTVAVKYCPRNCMGRGTCSNGVCKCKSGFKGVDCALRG